MKGADQCPRCGSRKHGDVAQDATSFYAAILRVCANCATAWEPFDEAEIWDRSDPACSFRHPCNNCAFRKDSPEHETPEKWRSIVDQLGWWDGSFYCHKGVPIEPESDDGFAYPRGRDGKPDVRKLRLCRGYLNWLNSSEARAKLAAQMAEEAT